MAHRDKSQSPEFTVGIDAKRTFVDKRSRPNLQRMTHLRHDGLFAGCRNLWGEFSLRLDTGELDHLAPLFGFVGNEFSELIGREPKN